MNINYQAPCNPMGYGVAGTQFAVTLRSLGHKVAWWPIGHVSHDDEYKIAVNSMIANQDFFNINAPSLRIWHQFDMAQIIGRGIHCGMPIFELDKFTSRELHHLDTLDKIFVNSHWAMTVVNNNLPNRIRSTYVTPLGVNRSTFNEFVGAPQVGWTTFLNVGKWELRKGHDVITQAFNKAFEPRDKVRLWMMNDNPFLTPAQTKAWQDSYIDTKMGRQVSFLPRVDSSLKVAQVMGDADCGVFPARAEGWNLELLEMMSMGKQVIATNYSAHTEFCTPDNSLLIQIDKLEDANDGVWFNKEGQWAQLGEAQIDQLVHHMRFVHKNKQLNVAGIETAKRFSWEAAAERLVKCIQMDSTDY